MHIDKITLIYKLICPGHDKRLHHQHRDGSYYTINTMLFDIAK